MKNILILDDELVRHEYFDKRLTEHTLCHAYTVQDCCMALLSHKFDVIFLDHDLHESDGYGNLDSPTGMDVCKYIVNTLPSKYHPKMVVIHSLNEDGAKNMESLLRHLPHLDIVMAKFRCWFDYDVLIRELLK